MTTKFDKLVHFYTSCKELYKQIERYDIKQLPTSVINIYSPEYDCFKPIYEGAHTKHYGISTYDMIEFFIHICNNYKFNTKEEIDKFYNFITKNISKYSLGKESLISQLCNESNISIAGKETEIQYTLCAGFLMALFEKTPKEYLNNNLFRKILSEIPTYATNKYLYNFVKYVNTKGLEFDTKTLKLLQKHSYDTSSIISKDVDVNVKKYNNDLFLKNIFNIIGFEESKKKFEESLEKNNIAETKVNLVFAEIDNLINTLLETKIIENLIKMKLHYKCDITTHDVYLLGQYTLTDKLNDDNLVKNIHTHFSNRQYVLDFDNSTIVTHIKKSQTVKDPEDRQGYGWITDCRYNFREILENIIAMGFSVKKYNQNDIVNILRIFAKFDSNYFNNIDTKINKQLNKHFYGDDKEIQMQESQEYIKNKKEIRESYYNKIKSYYIIDKIYSGEYNKEYIKFILCEYNYVFVDMIKTKQNLINLIDNDIISMCFALNYGDIIEYLYNNKILMQNDMTEYILYTQDIEGFLDKIYSLNMRLTNQAYTQLSSLIPKTTLKTLELKKYLIDDEKLSESVCEKLNKMTIFELMNYIQNNYKSININDILNMKDNNGRTYILNYISKQNNLNANNANSTNNVDNVDSTNSVDSVDNPNNVDNIIECTPKKIVKKVVKKTAADKVDEINDVANDKSNNEIQEKPKKIVVKKVIRVAKKNIDV